MTSVTRGLARLLRRPLAPAIEGRLGGYRQRINHVDERAPLRITRPISAAVIGGGLAGIAAAATLAERGFAVTLFEQAPRVGGKIGSERIAIGDAEYDMDHGFHAFFRHYYNLNEFLRRCGAQRALVPVSDYAILGADGQPWSFGDVATTPGLNLLDLAGKDVYRLAEVLFGGSRRHMNVFLEYERARTFAAFDGVSFAQWADQAGLPARLRRVLSIFARAFFAEDDRLSTAEVVKAFHFYYLAHDHGLLYDYPAAPYASALLDSIEAHLIALGVRLQTGVSVSSAAARGQGFSIEGAPFDELVIATPAGAARALARRSPQLSALLPQTARRLDALRSGQRYAVLRIWIDRDLRSGLPVFVATERTGLLDAVASYHRITDRDAAWAAARPGHAVLELHCYAVPDGVTDDAAVRARLLEDLARAFPELAGLAIVHECLRVRDDFTALHVGMAAQRPGTTTEHEHLMLAGDWVALPVPAMLMEGAFTSGLYAANAILRREGLREAPIDSVPLAGLLAPTASRGARSSALRGDPVREGTPSRSP